MNYQFVRFLMVGFLNTVVGLSVMYILLHLAGLSYWISTCLGNSIGAVVSYFLNRRFTFRSHSTITKSMLRFIAVILFCYVVSYTIGRNIVEWVLRNSNLTSGIKTDIAVFISTGFYTVLNYLCQKVFVFKVMKHEEL
ncbi:GtrA family protein [Cytobacillus sp. Hz8]|uniref:GtrA family protein n=1 Tax=Cytobacillus sp. Hz8 TaxID=3347168 RepID=UPI0035DBCA07